MYRCAAAVSIRSLSMPTDQVAEPAVEREPGNGRPDKSRPDNGRHQTIELEVTGMTCGSCVARVQSALGSAPGVADATVNYATGRATVDVASDETDAQRLVEVVERIGYGAQPVAESTR